MELSGSDIKREKYEEMSMSLLKAELFKQMHMLV